MRQSTLSSELNRVSTISMEEVSMSTLIGNMSLATASGDSKWEFAIKYVLFTDTFHCHNNLCPCMMTLLIPFTAYRNAITSTTIWFAYRYSGADSLPQFGWDTPRLPIIHPMARWTKFHVRFHSHWHCGLEVQWVVHLCCFKAHRKMWISFATSSPECPWTNSLVAQ